MKTQVNKLFRWGAAGVFALMLTLNVIVGLDFEKHKSLPSITLIELGNKAMAQSETSEDFTKKTGCVAVWENVKCYGYDKKYHTYAESKN